LECPGNTLHVLGPIGEAVARLIDRKAFSLTEIEGMNRDRAVLTGPEGYPDCQVDGHGQHKTIIVIGVLTDQVHPPRRTNDEAWMLAKTARELLKDPFLNRQFHSAL
jgi:hypothetical protein